MMFSWQALDAQGQRRRGTLEADTPRQARQLLREQGLTPQSLAPKRNAAALPFSSTSRIKISSADLALVTRQLATLTAAALPLEEVLAVIARQCQNRKLTRILQQIREKVLAGHSLADALLSWPRIFDPIYRTLVKAGEKSGRLGFVLEKLADYNEIRQQMRAKFTQALIYPVMLSTIAVAVVIILLTTVVPKVTEQFIHMKQQLPVTTRTLLAISNGLQTWGPWLLMALIMAFITLTLWLRRPGNRHRFHRFLLTLRLCRGLISAINGARYLRTLSILQSSGVPLLDAMNIATEGIINLEVHHRLLTAAEHVRQGNSFHLALENSGLFPPMMLYMIATGEKSGQLGELMARAADNQDTLLQNRLSLALALFEPALIITMAAVVLFIVASVLQPILQLNTLVS
ncbi:type II secretion system inner membrane protein GspF [Enterobacillus tribolii]|uniref:Type II secretion system protein F (GspF) n=1 Tax=Enterobacillus tribolii TaxID=1487935 RepID=A0A370Q5Z0_9GAMM|nr:type II secretion system inner membrane protein GspF [Enterobacillus tribolii]MBW7985035.1 type II secretion system protein GspF [Enterobacillus tribolii]RDK83775.1 type II secretion system protein F (GspF) [Enterobacillus tribolii]